MEKKSINSNSAHLEIFPDFNNIPIDNDLLEKFKIIRSICNNGLSIRNQKSLRVRLPLSSAIIYSKNKLDLDDYSKIIKDEINVKEVVFSSDIDLISTQKVLLNLKKCGTKLGKETPKIMKLINSGEYKILPDGRVNVADIVLEKDEFELKLILKEGEDSDSFKQFEIKTDDDQILYALMYLNTNVTQELENEGIARDIVRFVQEKRKNINLNITDKIKIFLSSEDAKIKEVLSDEKLLNYICEQSLGVIVENNPSEENKDTYQIEKIGKATISIGKID